MENEAKCQCKHCGTDLPPSYTGPCPKCGKSGKLYKESVGGVVRIHGGIKVRHKRKGFRKFMTEIIQGWFPSGDPKLNKGVDIVRIIDKEKKGKKEYHQIVKDAATGAIIHEEHEPLEQHYQQKKQTPNK